MQVMSGETNIETLIIENEFHTFNVLLVLVFFGAAESLAKDSRHA